MGRSSESIWILRGKFAKRSALCIRTFYCASVVTAQPRDNRSCWNANISDAPNILGFVEPTPESEYEDFFKDPKLWRGVDPATIPRSMFDVPPYSYSTKLKSVRSSQSD